MHTRRVQNLADNYGKVVGGNLMCSGVDSGGFDAENKLIFESCGEGVVSVIKEVTPDYYELVDTVKTELFAKTMTFDAKTKNIYLPTAEFEDVPNTDPKFPYPVKRQVKPGSFHVVVLTTSPRISQRSAVMRQLPTMDAGSAWDLACMAYLTNEDPEKRRQADCLAVAGLPR